MDFSQVKSLTIPEGDVKKIEIGGTTVWQKIIPITSITIDTPSPLIIEPNRFYVISWHKTPSDATTGVMGESSDSNFKWYKDPQTGEYSVKAETYVARGSSATMGIASQDNPNIKGSILVKVPRLPEALQETSYISSTGTQYIKTKTNFSSNYTITAEMFVPSTQPYAQSTYFGAENTSSPYNSTLMRCVNSQYNATEAYPGYNKKASSTVNLSAKSTIEMKGSASQTYFKINGKAQPLSSHTETLSSLECYLFAMNAGGTATRFSKFNLCSFSITIGSNLVKNFVPCYVKSGWTMLDVDGVRRSAGRVGLYDLVTQKFYVNSASGADFGKGTDVF